MALSSVHRHASAESEATVCVDCSHHTPHAGHLSSAATWAHDCVLCQFLGLPFVGGSALVFAATVCFRTVSVRRESVPLQLRAVNLNATRGPPAVL